MKNRKILKITAVIVFSLSLVACGAKPDETITFQVPKESASLTFMFYVNDEAMLKFKVK